MNIKDNILRRKLYIVSLIGLVFVVGFLIYHNQPQQTITTKIIEPTYLSNVIP